MFLTGGFSSGSTLLYTLFRKAGEFHCLYEPLHERLLEHLYGGLRVYEHHYFVDDYFDEYKGLKAISNLHDPKWGTSGLHLPASAEAPDLYRYISYLVGASFAKHPKVLLKENRITFRLAWLRAAFPQAKIIHIYRDCEKQWNSTVKRGQAFFGRQDVGQDSVTYNGMNIATWCDDLAPVYPELAAERSKTGYERFTKLWELSLEENRRHAHLTIRYEDLTKDFETVCGQIWAAVPCTTDYAPLKRWVVPAEKQGSLRPRTKALDSRLRSVADRIRFKYGKFRLALASLFRGSN